MTLTLDGYITLGTIMESNIPDLSLTFSGEPIESIMKISWRVENSGTKGIHSFEHGPIIVYPMDVVVASSTISLASPMLKINKNIVIIDPNERNISVAELGILNPGDFFLVDVYVTDVPESKISSEFFDGWNLEAKALDLDIRKELEFKLIPSDENKKKLSMRYSIGVFVGIFTVIVAAFSTRLVKRKIGTWEIEEIVTDLHPMKIKGNWAAGRVLDWHVESSEFIGHDELGHAQYDTKRTNLGELVYKLKYKDDTTVLDDIVRIICSFAKFRSIDAIIPVPPSNISRTFQPVVEVAKRLGNYLEIQVFPDAIRKTKNTPEVKNVSTQQEKYDILKDVFEVVEPSIKGKTVLVLDDLYQSGATLRAITDVLYKQGGVGNVKVLALTMTKRR